MKHFEHRIIPSGDWQRLHGTTPTGPEDARPHFVPLTPEADRFVAIDAFGGVGSTGYCPGKILVDGEWKHAYRFIEIMGDVDELVGELDAEVDRCMAAWRK